MKNIFLSQTRLHLRSWLVLGYVLFIIYASLSPFVGWREQGLAFSDVLQAPLLLTYTAFDAVINLLSYLPLGLLVALLLRIHSGAAASVIFSTCLCVMLSACMEYLQMYLPSRTSSNLDVLTNGMGAFTGAVLAASMTTWRPFFSRLTQWRNEFFHHGKEMDFGLALLALWVFGQINPSLPMLGNVFISEAVRQPFVTLLPAPFDGWESAAVTLNLLMLGTLMLTLLRTTRDLVIALLTILSLVALAKFITAVLLLKSWAVLLWVSSEAVIGILLGMLLLFTAIPLSRATVIKAGAVIALASFGIVNFVFDDNTPSAAMSVYHWRYRHLLNYNGLAQTITLIFPLLLLFHLWRVRKL